MQEIGELPGGVVVSKIEFFHLSTCERISSRSNEVKSIRNSFFSPSVLIPTSHKNRSTKFSYAFKVSAIIVAFILPLYARNRPFISQAKQHLCLHYESGSLSIAISLEFFVLHYSLPYFKFNFLFDEISYSSNGKISKTCSMIGENKRNLVDRDEKHTECIDISYIDACSWSMYADHSCSVNQHKY